MSFLEAQQRAPAARSRRAGSLRLGFSSARKSCGDALLRGRQALLLTLGLGLAGCGEEQFARVYRIAEMAQTIGGPAAAARPGDLMLENERIRAVIHGRPGQRSTFPVSAGSLTDLDLQRARYRDGVGHGHDTFYELGPMVNLKVSSATQISHGICSMPGNQPSTGVSPCPGPACARVSVAGKADNVIGMGGMLDLAIDRNYPSDLEIITDYDLCPGDELVRVTTTARIGAKGEAREMEELPEQTGLLDVFLGEHTGKECSTAADCGASESCDKLLVELSLGGLNTQMRRCRRLDQKIAGVLAGDLMLFSGKASIFIPGNGFDHESYVRSLFDSGGDVFSAPLARPYVAAVGDKVSYAYFNQAGQIMIPVFSEAFTVSMTNRGACTRGNPGCLEGKEQRFRRFVSVGHGDVASALEGFYRLRKIPTGRLEGHVVSGRASRPLSNLDVYVFGVPQAWRGRTDLELGAATVEELVAQNQKESRTTTSPAGEPGLLSHFRTDAAPYDSVPDGSFAGSLPPGRYLLLARAQGLPASRLVPVQVSEGKTSRTTLLIGEPVRLQYQIKDASGRPLPAKLTIGHCFRECARDQDCPGERPVCGKQSFICEPAGGYQGADSCRPDQLWGKDPVSGQQTCVCDTFGRLPLAMRGSRYADGVVQVVHSATGTGEVLLEPGPVAYQVIVSRGFEYEIHRAMIEAIPGKTQRLVVSLPRVVTTPGWVSGDFHVHGPNSVDSGLDHERRVVSYVAEGVELLTATDHDHLTDYEPTIRQMNLNYWIKSQTGLEVSPLDYGHFLGFPLRFDHNADLRGAFHWRTANDKGESENLKPVDIYSKLRGLGALGPDQTVIAVAHFYDHFTYYSVDPWSLEMPPLAVTAFFNPVVGAPNFSGEFDALEVFNGKNFDLIRRPTYQEVRDYNIKLAAFMKSSQELPYETRQQRWAELSGDAQREFMRRTVEEQKVAIAYDNPLFECRCSLDEECGPGWLCDEGIGNCVAACSSDASCDQERVGAGREGCQPVAGDATRRRCQRLPGSCTTDADCTVAFGTSKEKCLAVAGGKADEKACQLSCSVDAECRNDPLRPLCDSARKVCAPASLRAARPVDPCPTLRGGIDDWFQMLNHGLRRTLLGSSDSHGTYSTEAGIPRTYVQVDTDQPQSISLDKVVSRIKSSRVLPTYGPFLELTLNDQPVGSTVTVAAGGKVRLHLRVQSPTWFDVDRIEVYRNGELIREIAGSVGCQAGSSDCIPVPNREVINYDGIIEDQPAQDAWYVVTAMGLDGKTLAPVYSSTPVARLGMYELIQRLTPLLPPLRSFRTPLAPSMGIVRPYAVSSPIWVDLGGDGFRAPQGLPSWATKADFGSTSQALTQTPHRHDHSVGLGRLREEAAQVGKQGLSAEALRHALDSLRYMSR